MFGLFKKKKEEDHDSMFHGIIMKLRKYVDNSDDTSAMLLINTKESGYCFIQGDGRALKSSLSKSMASDPGFATILRNVVNEHDNPPGNQNIPKALADILDQVKNEDQNVEEFKIPGIGKVLSIEPDSINNLSDEEVDKIIKSLIDEYKDDEDESEG